MIHKDIDWIISYVGKTYGSEGLKTYFKQYELQDTCKGRQDAAYYDCMFQKMNCGLEEVISKHHVRYIG